GGSFDSKTHQLSEILKEFQVSVETQLESTAARLEIECQPNNIAVNVNRHAIVSILQNLMDNAIQACQQTAFIKIAVTVPEKDRVKIHFSDNGSGINSEIQAQIFEPFFTTRSQGSGLGLAVADSVLRSHGGKIDIFSSTEQGTTFRIVLPIAAE
ncbi:MAG: two-component system sensor histidine kinase FlrB, partial [Planctomycetota bacterium]